MGCQSVESSKTLSGVLKRLIKKTVGLFKRKMWLLHQKMPWYAFSVHLRNAQGCRMHATKVCYLTCHDAQCPMLLHTTAYLLALSDVYPICPF